MAKKTDSNIYTIVFAIIMVVVVGSLLSFASEFTKEDRRSNEEISKMQEILFALNIKGEDGGKVDAKQAKELFDKNVKEQLVIVDGVSTPNDKAFLIDIKKEADKAKADANYKMQLPLFIGETDGKKTYIMPVRGVGLWGPIWGNVAVDDSFQKISGIYFDHAAETPGLGSKITLPFFYEDFVGESIVDANKEFKGISVTKTNKDPENNDKNDNEVDAISGATITGNGVDKMIKKCVGRYIPYFQTLKK